MRDKQIAIIAKGSGISYSFDAVNTKCYYMAKALKSYGLNVTILSSIYYQPELFGKKVGKYKGIKYYIPSVYPKASSKIKQIYYKLAHTWRVTCFLIYLKLRWGKIHYIFDDNSTPFPFLLFFKWLGIIDLIFNLEEWPLAHNISYKRKMYSHYFTVCAFKNCKKIVCISSYLIAQAIKYNNKSRVFKLPALTEFNESNCDTPINTDSKHEITRFLYCGNVVYSEVIDTIIGAYENICRLRKNVKVELLLILHGNELKLQKFSDYARQLEYPIEIKSNLSESDLLTEYSQASVFLAPLRLTVQDQARFPQKIAEYVSLSKPIITTFVGDIGLYFESDKNAIFIDDFTVAELEKKMNYSIDNNERVVGIGVEGNAVGRKYFNYKKYINEFGDFVTS
ncbi:MAG: glycosyltransferase [Proteobacteria bacterium]|nr:glycosyltransferase [Pseudomonadota bacterium]